MANLAGFDVVLEAALDLLELWAATTPDIEAGQLTFSVPDVLGNFAGSASVNVILEGIRLLPVVGSNLTHLVVDFRETSYIAKDLTLSLLAGSISIPAQLIAHAPKFDKHGLGTSFIAVKFNEISNASPVVLTLDDASLNELNTKLGPAKAQTAVQLIAGGLGAQLSAKGTIKSSVGVTIKENGRSDHPAVLADVPVISWIDGQTLGIFGYYNRGNQTGNAAAKHDSDLTPNDLLGIAFLLSSHGFRDVVAHPAVVGAATDRVKQENKKRFVTQEQAADNNTGKPTKREQSRAEADLSAYIESPDGQSAVAAIIPPPFGNGTIEYSVSKSLLGVVGADGNASLTWFDIICGTGAIDLVLKAQGETHIKVIARIKCGSIKIEAHPSVALKIESGAIVPQLVQDASPNVDISSNLGCKVAVNALAGFIGNAILGGVETWATSSVTNTIAGFTQGAFALPKNALQIGGNEQVTFKDITITPDYIRIRADAPYPTGSLKNTPFHPEAQLIVTPLPSTASRKPAATDGVYDFPGTPYGCPPGQYAYTRRWFDTGYTLGIKITDLALPTTTSAWTATLGHAFGFDPRPTWTGAAVPLATPVTTLQGETAFQYPPPNGSLQSETIALSISQTTDGYEIKAPGAAGRFFLLVQATVTDAAGQVYPVQGILPFFGEEVDFGEDYVKAMQACAQKAKPAIQTRVPTVAVGATQKFTWGENMEDLTAQVLGQALVNGDPGALSGLVDEIQASGPGFSQRVLASFTAQLNARSSAQAAKSIAAEENQ